MKTIDEVANKALCCGCGACVYVCPVNAINIYENAAGFIRAYIDNDKCIKCGKCVNVCPSVRENQKRLIPENVFIGTDMHAYIGYAVNPEVRQKSQSGGVVTALLQYLLTNKMIDVALVNKFDAEKKRPVVVEARNEKEIFEGRGSYYSQSSVLSKLKDVSGEKVGIVTLGCQSEAIKLIQEKNGLNDDIYVLGLVCLAQNSGLMIDELISKIPVSEHEKVNEFRFKDKDFGGWPGNVSIKTDKEMFMVPKKERNKLKEIYECYRCIQCYDQMNIFSDISFGDPWGIEEHTSKGETVFISHTKKGEKLIQEAIQNNIIVANEIDINRVYKGQTLYTRNQKKCYLSAIVTKENNLPYVYDNEISNKLQDVKYNKKEKKTMRKRLKYAYSFYTADSINEMDVIRKTRKRKLYFKNIRLEVISIIKRIFRKIKKIIFKR